MWNHSTLDNSLWEKVISDVRLTNPVVNQQLKTLKVRVNYSQVPNRRHGSKEVNTAQKEPLFPW